MYVCCVEKDFQSAREVFQRVWSDDIEISYKQQVSTQVSVKHDIFTFWAPGHSDHPYLSSCPPVLPHLRQCNITTWLVNGGMSPMYAKSLFDLDLFYLFFWWGWGRGGGQGLNGKMHRKFQEGCECNISSFCFNVPCQVVLCSLNSISLFYKRNNSTN